jgi:hypothetical protein
MEVLLKRHAQAGMQTTKIAADAVEIKIAARPENCNYSTETSRQQHAVQGVIEG